MKTPMRFSIMGGDVRQARLAELVEADGHEVSTFGIDALAISPALSARECMEGADCVVLPIPVMRDAGMLNAPALRRPQSMGGILDAAVPGQVLVGGRVPADFREQGRRKGLVILDVLEREDFAVRNAVPTAEGALQIALENTPVTLHGSRCLVIGFGRIGRVLARLLRELGARVTVSARRQDDFAWMDVCGYETLHTGALEGRLAGFDVIFNTVPAIVLPKERLEELSPSCLCIDLASTPGGIDFDAAHEMGIRCIWALGLPSKVAPKTAGLILRDTLYHIMSERKNTE